MSLQELVKSLAKTRRAYSEDDFEEFEGEGLTAPARPWDEKPPPGAPGPLQPPDIANVAGFHYFVRSLLFRDLGKEGLDAGKNRYPLFATFYGIFQQVLFQALHKPEFKPLEDSWLRFAAVLYGDASHDADPDPPSHLWVAALMYTAYLKDEECYDQASAGLYVQRGTRCLPVKTGALVGGNVQPLPDRPMSAVRPKFYAHKSAWNLTKDVRPINLPLAGHPSPSAVELTSEELERFQASFHPVPTDTLDARLARLRGERPAPSYTMPFEPLSEDPYDLPDAFPDVPLERRYQSIFGRAPTALPSSRLLGDSVDLSSFTAPPKHTPAATLAQLKDRVEAFREYVHTSRGGRSTKPKPKPKPKPEPRATKPKTTKPKQKLRRA